MVIGIRNKTSLFFRFTWPCIYPSIYGGAPPVSTRISAHFCTSPHFLRSTCP